MMNESRQVLIFGATGNVGGAAARELLQRGWQVRAVTRNPQSEKAQALAKLGAKIVQADMDDRNSLDAAFTGITKVFSVQNWSESGVDGEIRQGKLVADAAKAAGVTHLVYGSAGIGEPGTGVPHFECKLIVENYMRDELGLPTTAVRPGPFMELMSAKAFYPALAAWGAMPKIVGWDIPLPWTAVVDIGTAIANIFTAPDQWIGRDVHLIGHIESLRDCQTVFKKVTGKKPFGLSLPMVLFNKMAGPEFEVMWRWMAEFLAGVGPNGLQAMVDASREVCPNLHSVESWLQMTHADAMQNPLTQVGSNA
jgi:uncharacterized protein YbjT (DUF2867 family)